MFEPRPPTVSCAIRAVEAWVDGADAMAPLQRLPAPSREIAKTIARLQCEMIQWHARRAVATGSLDGIHEKWLPLVERYLARKLNKT